MANCAGACPRLTYAGRVPNVGRAPGHRILIVCDHYSRKVPDRVCVVQVSP